MTAALAGVAVLVTRPLPLGQLFAARLEQEGASAVLFPGVRIEAVQTDAVREALRAAHGADLVIFVSPSAVQAAMPFLQAEGSLTGRVAAIGPGTAQALRSHGMDEVIVAPEGHDSEALAAHPALQQVAGRRVAVIRGMGGRPVLAEHLRGRGAQLQVVECYRRLRPEGSLGETLAVWQKGQAMAWSATSAEILDNLFALAGEAGSAMLRSQVLLVPHARIAVRAFLYGVQRILVTGPGDAGMVTGLKTWFGGLRDLNRQKT